MNDRNGDSLFTPKRFKRPLYIAPKPPRKAPYSEYAQRPEAFDYWWGMMQYVFHVPDPKSFPRATYSAAEVELLEQYVRTCRELASMTVLSHEGGITFTEDEDGERIDRNLPPVDTTRGALVTLRQLEKPGEDASFSKVWKAVGRRMHEADPVAAKRHNRYRLVQNKLMNGYLKKMADVLAATAQGWDTTIMMSIYRSGKPQAVIDEAMYTGHVHWNRQRAAAGAMGQKSDAVFEGIFEMDVYESVLQLSHWKFVYAEFIEHQLGSDAPPSADSA